MEFTFKTIVVLVIIFSCVVLLVSMIMNWGADINNWFKLATEPFFKLFD